MTTATEQETKRYNGWTNYPTWAVNLWLSNDEGLYNETKRLAGQVVEDSEPLVPSITMAEARLWNMAELLKEWVSNELAPDLGASFAADLLGYALGEVDWYEIAAAWLEDA